MVVLDSLALAITVSNDLVMPLLLRRRLSATQAGEGDIGALVLWVRRLAIVGVLTLGFVYERVAGEAALVLDRAAVLRRRRADRPGLSRRALLAARHRARRHRRE